MVKRLAQIKVTRDLAWEGFARGERDQMISLWGRADRSEENLCAGEENFRPRRDEMRRSGRMTSVREQPNVRVFEIMILRQSMLSILDLKRRRR